MPREADPARSSARSTGSWVVHSSDCGWLTLAGNGHGFGAEPDALVFPTKTAARAALKGYRRARGEDVRILRAYSHEEAQVVRDER